MFDDVYDCFRELHEAGYDLYIVSNGNPAVLDSMVERAEIRPFIEDTINADEVETYKPALSFYQHAAEHTGVAPENLVHVATPWYDIYGANNAGCRRFGSTAATIRGKPSTVNPTRSWNRCPHSRRFSSNRRSPRHELFPGR